MKCIPLLEKEKNEANVEILRLQSDLQHANDKKSRFKEQLVEKEGIENLHGIASKISQMILKREEMIFTEREQTVFRDLLGQQVIDAINQA